MSAAVEPMSLGALLDGVLRTMQPHFVEKGIVLRRSIPRRAPPSIGDERRLEQVFNNLLVNALSFTPARGTISVLLRARAADRSATGAARPERLIVTIRDTGPEIDADLLPHVFEPFRSERKAGGGLGLGLAIARHIVHAHDGKIVASSAPGGGACFRTSAGVEALSRTVSR